MKHAVLLISLLFIPIPVLAGTEVAGEFEAVVTWVVDGDSIRFRETAAGREDECRMLHYNAPEMTGKERPEGRKALRKLMELVKGKRVMIWGMDRDHYGRLLCEVRLMDGTYINAAMRYFLKDYKKRDIFLWKEKGQKRRQE